MNSKSINKEILSIAIPSILEQLFITLASIIDSKMVSSMGITAISAISVTNQPRLFLMCVFFAINIVASTLTARYIGEKNRDGANQVLVTTLVLTIISVLVLSTLSVAFAKPIMVICSNQQDTLADSIIYFRIIMGGLIFNVIFIAINAVLRGCGKTNLTFISNVISCSTNVLFNYLLIEGHLGFPALKIKGAAIATVLGNVAAMIVCLVIAFKDKEYANLDYCIKNKIHFSLDTLKQMWGMWDKVFPENVLNRVGFLAIGIMTSRTGSLNMSVYSVGMHLLNINFAIGTGYQSASVALIGRSFGAKDNGCIKMYSKKIIKLAFVCGIAIGVVALLFGKEFYSFFGSDSEFVYLGQLSSIVIGITCPLQVLQIVLTGILQGLGEMASTLKFGFIANTVVNTIVTFVLTSILGIGVFGVWIGSLACQIVKIVLCNKKLKEVVQ